LSAGILRRLLAHPLTAEQQIDDPVTTELRKRIIASKPFLRAIYDQWYGLLAEHLPPVPGPVLELGSGAGYCQRFIASLITSDVFLCSGIQTVADAQRIPFSDGSLRAIVFTDVLHHLPDVRRFLGEAERCLHPGGKILMIEPWVSPWSRFVFTRFHHEPFRPEAETWEFPSSGPLSGANGALPWIVFVRDRSSTERQFPELSIETIRPFMPFRYLLSGGVSARALMPGFTHALWRKFEELLEPYMSRLAMFAFISVRKG